MCRNECLISNLKKMNTIFNNSYIFETSSLLWKEDDWITSTKIRCLTINPYKPSEEISLLSLCIKTH